MISSSLYRRRNAPSSANDEQGWVISIRDEWSFVWHLFGISPYHQNVYEGQVVPKGYIVGHVSSKPLASKRPLDQDPPVDPPEKPPGGDGNPLYPYRFRELRIGVARPGRGWKEWRDAYDNGWTWYDPLRFLGGDGKVDGQQVGTTRSRCSEASMTHSLLPLLSSSCRDRQLSSTLLRSSSRGHLPIHLRLPLFLLLPRP